MTPHDRLIAALLSAREFIETARNTMIEMAGDGKPLALDEACREYVTKREADIAALDAAIAELRAGKAP